MARQLGEGVSSEDFRLKMDPEEAKVRAKRQRESTYLDLLRISTITMGIRFRGLALAPLCHIKLSALYCVHERVLSSLSKEGQIL